MSVPLDPFGNVVVVGQARLRTPGLAGEADEHAPATSDTRALVDGTAALEAALAAERMVRQTTVELRGTAELDAPGVPTRATDVGEPAIELTVPDAGPEWGQVVLATDESGVVTWNFARDAANRPDVTRGAGERTYVIRRTVPPPAAGPAGERGLLGAVGKKLFQVLAFRIIDPIVGEVGEYFAGRWEARNRPYRLRTFTPDDYASPGGRALEGDDWRRIGAGRALLMLHGTFSRAHAAFGGLPPAFVADLHRRYGGRVFAFDHFTLSEDPDRNVERLVSMLPPDARLDLDVVGHSRGGLVARALAERQGQLSLGARTIGVRRVVFVAVPNAGTVLADGDHWNDLIDTYTNLLEFVPDNGVTEQLEAIVTVVKHLAVGVLKGLDGLRAMVPGGPFLSRLNAGVRDDKRYFALGSDFEPADAGWKAFVADRLLDRIFRDENDLVVPTRGVWDRNGSGFFPIDDRQVLPRAEAVAHTRFFTNPRALETISAWLAA
jgi:pimeloyl-ACP methyl ester carboxylesterase